MKKTIKSILKIGVVAALLALVSFKAPQGSPLVQAARSYSLAEETYQDTSVGARQYELRSLVCTLYVNSPNREKYHAQLFALGADLKQRIEREWAPKIANGTLKPDPAQKATPEELLAAAAIYAQHWESSEHQAAWTASKDIMTMRLIQSEARKVFDEGGTFQELWAQLEKEGFTTDNIGDKRLYGRLENLFTQWEEGNLDYFTVPVAK